MKKRRGELGDIWSLFVVPSDSTSDHVPVNSYLNEITMFLMLVTYVHAYNQNYPVTFSQSKQIRGMRNPNSSNTNATDRISV